jgi:UPF0042 nucleotide-binding protein
MQEKTIEEVKIEKEELKDINFVIISGLSGAGKSLAVKYFEDLGFFCVDNLPATLIPKFVELCIQSAEKIKKIALVIDIREKRFLKDLEENLNNLKRLGLRYKILFLEASEEVLIRRFSESRRKHPLGEEDNERSILEVIREEKKLMEFLRENADLIINTSYLTPQALQEVIKESFATSPKDVKINITFLSFGYKYGIPLDVDLVFDVRFLPNPYYVKELQNLKGDDPRVVDYIMQSPVTCTFLLKFFDLITFLVPHYIAEGKAYLTIAVGCTGGKHRSIALVNTLADLVSTLGLRANIVVKHRDINRP